MHTCETCGKEWPENYCPECAHTIGKAAKPAVPPPLPPQTTQPPPVPPQRPTTQGLSTLFGLFKKQSTALDPTAPHPHHRNVVRMAIPGALARYPAGFLTSLSDPGGSQTLEEYWRKCGAAVLPPELLVPPTGLTVSGFRYENYVCFLIIFPAPKAAGESYFGFIVAGPSTDWSAQACERVPVSYFVLERSTNDIPTIFQWRPSSTEQDEEIFDTLGPGPSPRHPPDFTALILSRFYGYDPKA